MQAIAKLRRSGMTTREIADGLGTESLDVIRSYEKFRRFPGRKFFVCFVEMAEARGMDLQARDFLPPSSETRCESETNET